MQYHSTEHLERHEEFRRMLILAAQGTSQLLIVSPDKIDTLEDYLKASFQEAPARKLRKEKSLKINDSLTVFLEAKDPNSGFSRGHVFIPWASMHTVDRAVNDSRSISTFYIPHSGPDSGPGTVDELALYKNKYPSSKEL
ncbi:hypothetical protein [Pseudomonas oryzicola]|uniref:Uncharacterized protein n=1 Tax=Pseudomonas oryzicola TaxID=485876 RepID=A0ABS6QBC9_9PSED|nr:hypothetical protein [Pseudomonas oryzicola]MBV4491411.1 hypothetical protein [Pseudomonas oryzicola]